MESKLVRHSIQLLELKVLLALVALWEDLWQEDLMVVLSPKRFVPTRPAVLLV